MSELNPCPSCNRHVASRSRPVRSARRRSPGAPPERVWPRRVSPQPGGIFTAGATLAGWVGLH